MPKEELVLWFEELSKDDVPIVGGKNANLGEMTKAKIPVPPGFAITAQAYKHFITETKIAQRIYETIQENVTDTGDPKQYQEASKQIRKLIEASQMPERIREAIEDAYQKLSEKVKVKNIPVAVRSSATAEDLPDASFAGQQETYLNVKGADELLEKTIKCWSSLFTPRAIFYRTTKGFKHEQVLISVGVQQMVNARSAGVLFTIDPVTGNRNQIVIEGTWGLGEAVVSGAETPDHFVVNKETLGIAKRSIAKKTVEYRRNPKTGKTEHSEIPLERQGEPCITDDEIRRLAQLGNQIEQHYGKPQDIEWAVDSELPFPQKIWIVQSRPETVWSTKEARADVETATTLQPAEMEVVARGLAAGRRDIGFGVAKVVFSTEEASRLMEKGDILVTSMTNPDFVPYMKMASAIVTDKGGVTAHAAIVSRELGIPCIVGAETATKTMVTGSKYTVDARNGVVYKGIMSKLEGTCFLFNKHEHCIYGPVCSCDCHQDTYESGRS